MSYSLHDSVASNNEVFIEYTENTNNICNIKYNSHSQVKEFSLTFKIFKYDRASLIGTNFIKVSDFTTSFLCTYSGNYNGLHALSQAYRFIGSLFLL